MSPIAKLRNFPCHFLRANSHRRPPTAASPTAAAARSISTASSSPLPAALPSSLKHPSVPLTSLCHRPQPSGFSSRPLDRCFRYCRVSPSISIASSGPTTAVPTSAGSAPTLPPCLPVRVPLLFLCPRRSRLLSCSPGPRTPPLLPTPSCTPGSPSLLSLLAAALPLSS